MTAGQSVTVQHLGNLFNACPIPVCVEQGRRLIYLNASARTLLGIQTVTGLLGEIPHGVQISSTRRLIGAEGCEVVVELASWPVGLDQGPATVVTFTPVGSPASCPVAPVADPAGACLPVSSAPPDPVPAGAPDTDSRGQRVKIADPVQGETPRLEAVLRSLTEGVVIADPDGLVRYMNPAALELLGIPSEEQSRRPIASFFDEFDLRTTEGMVLPVSQWPLVRVLRGETFSGYEVEVRRGDARKSFVGSFGAAPVLDETGRVILVVQTIRDVTSRHEIENALRRSDQERDLALQASQMSAWRWEYGDGGDPAVDLPAVVAGGRSGSGSPLNFSAIHPEDRPRLQRFGEDIRTGKAHEIEYRVLLGRGGYIWQSSRGRTILSGQGELVGLTGVTWDITDRKKAEAEIERMNASLHQLSGELLRLQDEQRRDLARELHDGPVQTLTGAVMNLSVLTHSAALEAFPRERGMAAECLGWVRQCAEEMRSLSYLLHPPILDELGLVSALRSWIRGFTDRTGIDVDLHLDETGRLGAECETALFRIAQESLSNVHRHSQSGSAAVRLYPLNGSIVLEVEDYGVGIPPGALEGRSPGHALGVGIQGMRERAGRLGGELTICSHPRRTVVKVILPERAVA